MLRLYVTNSKSMLFDRVHGFDCLRMIRKTERQMLLLGTTLAHNRF